MSVQTFGTKMLIISTRCSSLTIQAQENW